MPAKVPYLRLVKSKPANDGPYRSKLLNRPPDCTLQDVSVSAHIGMVCIDVRGTKLWIPTDQVSAHLADVHEAMLDAMAKAELDQQKRLGRPRRGR